LWNFTVDAHPIHPHLVVFQVINREDMATGQVFPPEPWEAGFKDTVIALPGQITRIKAKFDIAGQYVWHCHIVEHEDNEMMRIFQVVDGSSPKKPSKRDLEITTVADDSTGLPPGDCGSGAAGASALSMLLLLAACLLRRRG